MNKKIAVVLLAGFGMIIGFLGLHYFIASRSTPELVEATVCRKYIKTRHHTRRINRRVYTTGEPYNVYYFELEFADGSKEDVEVSLNKYNKTRSGGKVTVTRQKGLFGIPVLKL